MRDRTSNIPPAREKKGYHQGMHGGEIYKAARKLGLKPGDLVDFSSNTNIFALELTQSACEQTPYPFSRYPDADCSALAQAVAGHEKLDAGNILCGNGAADLIWQAFRAFAPSRALFLGPVFSEYIRVCEALGINYEIVRTKPEEDFACGEEALRRLWESRAELAVICTPNNPGGITYANIQNILSAVRSPRILVDLSYREFLYGEDAYETNSWNAYQNMVGRGVSLFTLHSATKFFCCPGIRLGYLCGDSQQISRLARQSPAWSVSQFAQDMGTLFYENVEEYRKTLPEMRKARYDLGLGLRRLQIFDPDLVLEGPNFFCCGLAGRERGYGGAGKSLSERLGLSGEGRAPGSGAPEKTLPGKARPEKIRDEQHHESGSGELQSRLLKRGLLIRDCDNIPGMPPGFVRIQVRKDADNNLLLKALNGN